MRNFVTALWLIFLISSTSIVQNTAALDTGPPRAGINAEPITTKVTLKFWGFSNNTDLVDSLTPVTSFIQQSYYPKDAEVGQFINRAYRSAKGDSWWTIQHQIQYKKEIMDSEKTKKLFDVAQLITFNVSNAKYQDENGTTYVDGKMVTSSQLERAIERESLDTGYTIHVLNFSIFDTKNKPHWLYGSSDKEYNNGSSDFRNLGTVNYRSVFYDPTAFVPFLTGTLEKMDRLQDQEDSKKSSYLTDKLNEIVEQIIINSPYSTPHTLLSFDKVSLHSSLIVLTNASLAPIDAEVTSGIKASTYQGAFLSAFPFFNRTLITTKSAVIQIDAISELKSFILKRIKVVNGEKVFEITPSVADSLKNIIRSNPAVYSRWPSGFLYMNIVFAFNKNLRVVYNGANGLRDYRQDMVGLGITDLHKWMQLNGTERKKHSILNYEYRVLGEMLGFHIAKEGMAKFVETPMSDYFVDRTFNYGFNQFEKDSLTRKYSYLLNVSIKGIIRDYIEELKRLNYDFVSYKELDNAEVLRLNATAEFQRGNFIKATRIFFKAYDTMINGIKVINMRINAVGNTVYWASGIIILLSIISILRSYEKRSKKELKRNEKGIPIEWLKKS